MAHAIHCLPCRAPACKGEDECRIFIQQMGQGGMDEEVFISELHITMNDLSKAGLAIPKCDVVSVQSYVRYVHKPLRGIIIFLTGVYV